MLWIQYTLSSTVFSRYHQQSHLDTYISIRHHHSANYVITMWNIVILYWLSIIIYFVDKFHYINQFVFYSWWLWHPPWQFIATVSACWHWTCFDVVWSFRGHKFIFTAVVSPRQVEAAAVQSSTDFYIRSRWLTIVNINPPSPFFFLNFASCYI